VIILSKWDPMQEAALAHALKMNSLDAQEARWKAQYDLATDSSYSSLYFSSVRIGASIVTKVVENILVSHPDISSGQTCSAYLNFIRTCFFLPFYS